MLVAAVAALVVSILVLGGGAAGIALDAAAVALALYALVRWSDSRGGAPEEDAAGHHYGDSIVDARTSVDPVIGMGPVKSDPPRHS